MNAYAVNMIIRGFTGLFVCALLAACSGSGGASGLSTEDGSPGKGGASTGGLSATGGYSATGGVAATGGEMSTGGAVQDAGSGGAQSTGGITATGGAPATGGLTGTGGQTPGCSTGYHWDTAAGACVLTDCGPQEVRCGPALSGGEKQCVAWACSNACGLPWNGTTDPTCAPTSPSVCQCCRGQGSWGLLVDGGCQ